MARQAKFRIGQVVAHCFTGGYIGKGEFVREYEAVTPPTSMYANRKRKTGLLEYWRELNEKELGR